jgi:hypothetical protein
MLVECRPVGRTDCLLQVLLLKSKDAYARSEVATRI